MAVLTLVGNNQHRGVVGCSFHVFSRWTTAEAAALVIAPRVWRALDRLLPIFSPRVLVRRDISHLRTDCRNTDRLLHAIFPALGAMAAAAVRR